MIYLHATAGQIWDKTETDKVGYMTSPRSCAIKPITHRNKLWACDNGAFTGIFDEDKYFSYLKRLQPYQRTCLFAVCPDTFPDPVDTMIKWKTYSSRIREMGYRAAFVCQDGQENLSLPDDYDVLFIGGSTEWKLGGGALDCIRKAKETGKWVHVGRVNSLKRIKHFMLEGVDSVDGTHVRFEPDKAIKRIIKWMKHQPLWKGEI